MKQISLRIEDEAIAAVAYIQSSYAGIISKNAAIELAIVNYARSLGMGQGIVPTAKKLVPENDDRQVVANHA
jgi:hypothetical protein